MNKKDTSKVLNTAKKKLREQGVSEPSIKMKLLKAQFANDPLTVSLKYADYIKQVVLNYAALYMNEEAKLRPELIHSKVLEKHGKPYLDTLIKLENNHYDPIFDITSESLDIQYKLIESAASALIILDNKFMLLVSQIACNMNEPGFYDNLKHVLNKYNKNNG